MGRIDLLADRLVDHPLVDHPLVDHHCHGLVRRDLSRAEFEGMLTEADTPGPPGTTLFDSQIGFAVRRWCAPVLGLPPHAEPDAYLARRVELGHEEVHRRLLSAAGIASFCVDTGFQPEPLTGSADLARWVGGQGFDVARLERIAELAAVDLLTGQIGVGHFAETVRARIAERAPTTIAVKSVAAYRAGLDLPADRPSDREVAAATRTWLGEIRDGAAIRLRDPVLHSFLIWCGVEEKLPVQIHVGYGDADLDLARTNPLLLTGLLRALAPTGASIMLLHCYPFHREAAYLTQVFPNVHLDLGLAIHNTGHGSAALLAEALELAPFAKVLFSTDAFALAELFLLGSTLFRRGLAAFLTAGIDDDAWTFADATRVARLICADNARRVYALP
ncbi:putative TIM-barrel fold metal-dependent hydrolase [Frankia canadensis]|uniref:Putative TIM-barrel fold metal-dependent hydrolase n=1 Tax=Frankia canadensis TaxID=1836972 RepID=A0A2I2KVX5_9ACTN|nr:amidohydrolase family protein [Frankia canadensis]SNQ49805.1 putative TIM-barrel fold metal-dependent hydrolase [Frankia canadensis]SOU57095.1 putative TIM-barrel fold metal-dependent hydrolase [Frankia canadensis]